MTGDLQTFGTVATTAGFTAVAVSGVKGVIASYQAYTTAPNNSLAESVRKLERVRSRLNGLSPQRREEIEAAIRSEGSNYKSLENLEEQLDECVLLVNAVFLSNLKFAMTLQSHGYVLHTNCAV
jgi:hypothetical protein